MKQYRTFILIFIILALSIWIVFPGTTKIGVANFTREVSTRLGLDLVGGIQVLLEADVDDMSVINDDDMRTAASIVENRVNGLGVEEANVQRAGDRYILVEIPGIDDPERAIETVKGTALLEFVDLSSLYDPTLPQDFRNQEAFALMGTRIRTTHDPGNGSDGDDEGLPVFPTIMTGAVIKNVGVSTVDLAGPQVAFELNDEGARIFAQHTSANIGRVLAIVLDKEVISTPTINDAITEGSGVISGNFTFETANQLAVQLRYGALPIPLKVAETRTIGPSLGEDSLQKSLTAGIIGFVIVILFMSIYYRLPGFVAVFAILSYAVITFALFRYIPVTLTLPGVAGLMLSTGSALDANILIFERLKEELREGRNLRNAVELGFQRAIPSIRDSNISTLITCAILFWFGSAFGATIVKGFSLTLAIGVGVSLFTAFVVTRSFLDLVVRTLKPTNLEKWFGL
jgi:preprotein translocase subunit SecD